MSSLAPTDTPIWPTARTTHQVVRADKLPGKLLWTREVFTARVTKDIQIGAVDGKVFFIGSISPAEDGSVVALDGKTGDLAWQNPGRYTLAAAPGAVYVADGTQIYAYEPATGEELWVTHLPGAYYISYLFVVDQKLHIKTTGNYFYYLVETETGRVSGRSQHGDIFTSISSSLLPHNPAITEQMLFLRAGPRLGKFSAVVAVDRKTEDIIWKTENNVISNVAATDTTAYVLTYDDEVRMLDALTGDLEVTIQFTPSINFFDLGENMDSPQVEGYHLAVDAENDLLFVILGDSNQLFAFHIGDE